MKMKFGQLKYKQEFWYFGIKYGKVTDYEAIRLDTGELVEFWSDEMVTVVI